MAVDSAGRVPPHAIEIEQHVLGTVLADPTKESATIVIEFLSEEAFWLPKHRHIFKVIVLLFREEKPTTSIDVGMCFRKRKIFAVSEAELLALEEKSHSASNLEYYCRILQEKMVLRESIRVLGSVITKAYDPASDSFDILAEAEQKLFSLSNQVVRGSSRSLDTIGPEIIHGALNPKVIDGCTGIPSRFAKLDSYTGGWQNSDLIILAGRPGMGKTSLGMTLALQANVPCVFFSLEMKDAQLAQRILAIIAKVNLQQMRSGTLSQADKERILQARQRFATMTNFFVEDTQELTLKEMRSKCLRLRSEHKIELILVDYLQLMHDPGQKYESREAEVSRIARGLKAIAKELDVPVIALAQLNREVESRSDKRPRLSDLRESGAIEQVADLVLMLYRKEVYTKGVTPLDSTAGETELLLVKHRNGPTGSVLLEFIKQTTHFIEHNPYRDPQPAEPSSSSFSPSSPF